MYQYFTPIFTGGYGYGGGYGTFSFNSSSKLK